MGRAVHRFIRDLTQASASVSMDMGKTGNCMNYKLTREHVRYAIETNDRLKFLKKIIEDVPKLDMNSSELINH